MDWFPTVAHLAAAAIPEGTVLRGSNIADIWHGLANDVTVRPRPLFWRGGGGPPPCWHRSPGLAVRQGDWKLLFSPGADNNTTPLRVELYNMSVSALFDQGSGGDFNGFNEFQNLAAANPGVVKQLMADILPWHVATPVPFGAPDNTEPWSPRWQPAGCESYPFPGRPAPDVGLLESNEAGAAEANAAIFRANLAAHQDKARPAVPAARSPVAGGGEVAELRAEVKELKLEKDALAAETEELRRVVQQLRAETTGGGK